MKKVKQEKNQGITLVALIITIIILIILAGVTLNIALGENGIFQKSKEVVDMYKDAAAKEQIELDITAAYLGGQGTLGQSLQEKGLSVAETDTGYLVADTSSNDKVILYTLNENGNIENQEEVAYTQEDVFEFDSANGAITGINLNKEGFYYEEGVGIHLGSGSEALTKIIIPKTIGGVAVKSVKLCEGSWNNPSNLLGVTTIIISDGINAISDNAFEDCESLVSIALPNSVTNIEGFAFHNCINLSSITIPNNITSIGNCAFESCRNLTSIIIPNSVTSIKGWTFGGCSNLSSITIPNSVTSIGDSAFAWCNLTSITIPDSVTSIENYAFYSCANLSSITIPKSVTSIGNYAFYDLKSGSTIYVETEAVKTLLSGKYSTSNTTVVVDASKFE